MIKAIVLSIEVSKMFPASHAIPDFSIDGLQRRSAAAAQLAKRLLGHEPGGDSVLIAGMLQDVGQLIFRRARSAALLDRAFDEFTRQDPRSTRRKSNYSARPMPKSAATCSGYGVCHPKSCTRSHTTWNRSLALEYSMPLRRCTSATC